MLQALPTIPEEAEAAALAAQLEAEKCSGGWHTSRTGRCAHCRTLAVRHRALRDLRRRTMDSDSAHENEGRTPRSGEGFRTDAAEVDSDSPSPPSTSSSSSDSSPERAHAAAAVAAALAEAAEAKARAEAAEARAEAAEAKACADVAEAKAPAEAAANAPPLQCIVS